MSLRIGEIRSYAATEHRLFGDHEMVLRTVLRLGRRNLLDISCIDSRLTQLIGGIIDDTHGAHCTVEHFRRMTDEHIRIRAHKRRGRTGRDLLAVAIGIGVGRIILD